MAYVKTWSTKEEVLKDLARASGRRTRKKDDLDEGYLVIGDAPPPVILEDEDAEMHLLFGEAASRKSIQTEEDATPDLAGIQQMIRMMQDFNSGDDDDTDDAANSKDCVIAISKVSRLNPNVQEFKPKGDTSPSPSTNSNDNFNTVSSKSNINKDINSNVVAQTVDVKTEESEKKTVEEVKVTESGDNNDVDLVLNVDENKYEDMATTLKNQISDAAKSDSYEFKKQKNVAIATLLRLYAKNNTSPKKCAAPLKLITPEYFEGKTESHTVVKVETPLDIVSTATSSTPEPRDSSTTLPSCSTLSTSTSSTQLETSAKIKLDPEIKKSIDKVNKWLEEPTKRKSPAVCLGPIAFKRREPINCKSPVSDSAPTARKPAVQVQKYQPSKYAADLGKQYLERNKVIESKQKDVTWVNLEDVLKEKDLAIKKRLEQQEQTSTSDT